MINSMQTAIIKKDFMSMISNKRLFPVLLIVPLIFTIVVPTIFILSIHFVPQEELGDFRQLLDMMQLVQPLDDIDTALMSLILNNVMPLFFVLIPIMAATVMAASSFVGEKEKRTLETLLYCPLSLKQIFHSKVWASFLVSMSVSFVSFILMMVVLELEILLVTGSMLAPDISWLVIMLFVSPSVSLLAITLIVGGSAKAQTVEESQQRSVFLILPVLFLAIGQFAGILLINALYLLVVGVIFSGLAFVFLKRSMRNFTYELLLR